LLRAYATDQAERHESNAERRAAAHRVLDHYMHSALLASVRLGPYQSAVRPSAPLPGVVPVDVVDKAQAAAWFEAESAVLLALIGYADADGFDEHAWMIPFAMAPYLEQSGRHQDWVATQWVAVAAASRLDDPKAQAHCHYQLGFALSSMGDNDAAEPSVRQALVLFRELGDRGHEAMVLNGLACMMAEQGRYSEALTVALDGLRMVKAAGYWWVQGTLENTVGELYSDVGKHDLGLSHCQRALALCREAGSRVGTGHAMDSIGVIHRQRGDLAQSMAFYEQALVVFRDSGAPVYHARSLIGLGETLAAGGDAPAARKAWLEAEAILDRLSHPLADEARANLAALDSRPEPDRVTGAVTTGR
jgi:tetratricopeptide (TPR) repeat protein